MVSVIINAKFDNNPQTPPTQTPPTQPQTPEEENIT
jgi:hypothetical protein